MELNDKVLQVISTIPTDGSFPYLWKKEGSYAGVTKDLIYKGETIAKADPPHTYCCGLEFEIYFRAAELAKIDLGSVQEVKRMRSLWFIAVAGKTKGPVDALVERGLGIEVSFNEAKAGDFMQLWRADGSGHSVTFLRYQPPVGVRYFSTQPITNGPGERTELYRDPQRYSHDIVKMHIARAIVPQNSITYD